MKLHVSKRTTTLDDVIYILPLDTEQREKLLKELPTYKSGIREEIKDFLWNAFHKYVDMRVKAKIAQYEEHLAEGKQSLNPDILAQSQTEVWNEFDKILEGQLHQADTEELQQVREKLSTLISVANKPDSISW